MIKEFIPRVGEMLYICFEDTVIITGCNGVLSKNSGQQIVINLALANYYSRRYELATITIDDGYCCYYHLWCSRIRSEFLDIVKDKYPHSLSTFFSTRSL